MTMNIIQEELINAEEKSKNKKKKKKSIKKMYMKTKKI